jgi:outer membrane protein assembly factor BamB
MHRKTHAARLPLCVILAAITTVPLPTLADSPKWLQWGGPDRNFICKSTGPLATDWPADGPKQLWKREIGDGYSTILVDGDTLYTMCRRDDKDAVLAIDARDGKTVWETTYEAPTRPGQAIDFGPGPHSTPAIDRGRIFTVSTAAKVHCLEQKTGKILWSHDMIAELGMKDLGRRHLWRGYGASPIVYRDLVIVTAGGEGVGVVAFQQDTGEVAWKSGDFNGSYPSPQIVTIGDEEHLIVFMGNVLAGLDPATGNLRWRHELDRRAAATMGTPFWTDDGVLITSAAYEDGTRALKIGKSSAGDYSVTEQWFTKKMRVQHGVLVRIGDTMYGCSGGFGPTLLAAVDVNTGDVLWRERGFAKANCIHADGKLIILDEEGVLAIATATPEKLTVHCRAQVLEKTAWTAPTLIGTRLYLRDRKTILALDLAEAG